MGRSTSRAGAVRRCDWCLEPMPPTKRRDARTCSKRCRQAQHRFRIGGAPAGATDRPMRFAYADPPYPGLAAKYYGCAEVDHTELVERLASNYPDGWALSTSASALRDVLTLCPTGVRVGAWIKGSRKGEALRARNAWEPLVVFGGRPRRLSVAEDLDDVLLWGGRQHSHPGALVGMKPAAFCEWMFRQLGATVGDTLDDLFPGSGAIRRAWDLHVLPAPASATVPSRLEEGQKRLAEKLNASPAAACDMLREYSSTGVVSAAACDPRGRRDG